MAAKKMAVSFGKIIQSSAKLLRWNMLDSQSWTGKKCFVFLHWEYHVVGGWALPLWKMMEFVSWDDDILNIWKNISAMFQTTNQIMDYPIPKFFGSVNRFFSFFNIDD